MSATGISSPRPDVPRGIEGEARSGEERVALPPRAGHAGLGSLDDPDPIFVRDGPVWTSAGVTAGIDLALAMVEADLGHALALAALAEQAGMSLRSFCRRYRRGTGRTPAEGVELIRLESARRHLEEGASVTRTAARCGFGSTETMRRAFLRHLAVAPTAYRDRFHG